MGDVNRFKLFLAGTLVSLGCLLFPVTVLAYGGGGGGGSGGEEGDIFGPRPATAGTGTPSAGTNPPEGFTPMDGQTPIDVVLDPLSTSSVGNDDTQREIEDQINQAADERDRNPEPVHLTPRQQAEQFISQYPPEVRQQLISRFSPEEILTIQFISRLQTAIRNEQDPLTRGVMTQGLISAQQNLVRDVAIRQRGRAAQMQRTKEDFIFVSSILAGIGVNIVTGGLPKSAQVAGIVANIGYNTATGGAKGGLTSAMSTAIGTKLPGFGVIGNAVRDQAVQEGLNKAIDTAAGQ